MPRDISSSDEEGDSRLRGPRVFDHSDDEPEGIVGEDEDIDSDEAFGEDDEYEMGQMSGRYTSRKPEKYNDNNEGDEEDDMDDEDVEDSGRGEAGDAMSRDELVQFVSTDDPVLERICGRRAGVADKGGICDRCGSDLSSGSGKAGSGSGKAGGSGDAATGTVSCGCTTANGGSDIATGISS